jgi:hypothetical protein
MSCRRKEDRMWEEWIKRRSWGKTGIGGDARLLENPDKFRFVNGRRCAVHLDT